MWRQEDARTDRPVQGEGHYRPFTDLASLLGCIVDSLVVNIDHRSGRIVQESLLIGVERHRGEIWRYQLVELVASMTGSCRVMEDYLHFAPPTVNEVLYAVGLGSASSIPCRWSSWQTYCIAKQCPIGPKARRRRGCIKCTTRTIGHMSADSTFTVLGSALPPPSIFSGEGFKRPPFRVAISCAKSAWPGFFVTLSTYPIHILFEDGKRCHLPVISPPAWFHLISQLAGNCHDKVAL